MFPVLIKANRHTHTVHSEEISTAMLMSWTECRARNYIHLPSIDTSLVLTMQIFSLSKQRLYLFLFSRSITMPCLDLPLMSFCAHFRLITFNCNYFRIHSSGCSSCTIILSVTQLLLFAHLIHLLRAASKYGTPLVNVNQTKAHKNTSNALLMDIYVDKQLFSTIYFQLHFDSEES